MYTDSDEVQVLHVSSLVNISMFPPPFLFDFHPIV